MNTRTRSLTAGFAVVTLLIGACAKEPAPADEGAQVQEPAPAPTDDSVQLTPTQDESAERIAAAQNRVASGFYSSIVPGLTGCWGEVTGKGAVQFKYVYARDGNDWTFQNIEADGTSLDKGQEAAAMQCMQTAARESRFPVDPEEAAQGSKEMVIHWSWPVPLPKDTTQLARMIVENPPGGECAKICHDCAWKPGQSFCAMACSGWSGCVEDGTGTGCKMTRPQCRSGWSGSFAGVFMARESGDVLVPELAPADREGDEARVASAAPR